MTVNPGGGPANSIQFGFNAGFKLSDSFIYQGSGITGLSDGVRYWVIPDPNDSTIIQLASHVRGRPGGYALPITSSASGVKNGNTLTFDPSVAIDSDTNTIDMGFNYALANTLPSGAPWSITGRWARLCPA